MDLDDELALMQEIDATLDEMAAPKDNANYCAASTTAMNGGNTADCSGDFDGFDSTLLAAEIESECTKQQQESSTATSLAAPETATNTALRRPRSLTKIIPRRFESLASFGASDSDSISGSNLDSDLDSSTSSDSEVSGHKSSSNTSQTPAISTLMRLESDLSQATAALEKTRHALSKKDNELKSFKAYAATANDSHAVEIKKITTIIESQREEITRLHTEQSPVRSSLEKSCAQLRAENKKLVSDLSKLQNSMKDVQNSSVTTVNHNDLKDKNRELQKIFDTLKLENQKLIADVKETQSHILSLTEKNATLERNTYSFQSSIAALNTEISSLKEKVVSLKLDLKSANAEIQSLKDKNFELERLNADFFNTEAAVFAGNGTIDCACNEDESSSNVGDDKVKLSSLASRIIVLQRTVMQLEKEKLVLQDALTRYLVERYEMESTLATQNRQQQSLDQEQNAQTANTSLGRKSMGNDDQNKNSQSVTAKILHDVPVSPASSKEACEKQSSTQVISNINTNNQSAASTAYQSLGGARRESFSGSSNASNVVTSTQNSSRGKRMSQVIETSGNKATKSIKAKISGSSLNDSLDPSRKRQSSALPSTTESSNMAYFLPYTAQKRLRTSEQPGIVNRKNFQQYELYQKEHQQHQQLPTAKRTKIIISESSKKQVLNPPSQLSKTATQAALQQPLSTASSPSLHSNIPQIKSYSSRRSREANTASSNPSNIPNLSKLSRSEQVQNPYFSDAKSNGNSSVSNIVVQPISNTTSKNQGIKHSIPQHSMTLSQKLKSFKANSLAKSNELSDNQKKINPSSSTTATATADLGVQNIHSRPPRPLAAQTLGTWIKTASFSKVSCAPILPPAVMTISNDPKSFGSNKFEFLTRDLLFEMWRYSGKETKSSTKNQSWEWYELVRDTEDGEVVEECVVPFRSGIGSLILEKGLPKYERNLVWFVWVLASACLQEQVISIRTSYQKFYHGLNMLYLVQKDSRWSRHICAELLDFIPPYRASIPLKILLGYKNFPNQFYGFENVDRNFVTVTTETVCVIALSFVEELQLEGYGAVAHMCEWAKKGINPAWLQDKISAANMLENHTNQLVQLLTNPPASQSVDVCDAMATLVLSYSVEDTVEFFVGCVSTMEDEKFSARAISMIKTIFQAYQQDNRGSHVKNGFISYLVDDSHIFEDGNVDVKWNFACQFFELVVTSKNGSGEFAKDKISDWIKRMQKCGRELPSRLKGFAADK
ncbi:hypothetical protein HK100_005530 [Physocladia obscura]|uniref:Uncharacterized protein n=1 Tax=Physocladia obscura TaxID=109957 RepID=A0AAD5X9A6_9FUNG|nr:hypothetical protein HK100_005530 [Physocladia obscura]